jgi:23S rRNA pseudouridine1911/1915/1917 synthase
MPIDPAKPFDLRFRVDPTWADLRLDRFVRAMVPSMSRTKIQKYIRDGRVEVNGAPRPANWKVREKDEVLLRCNVPEEGEDAGRRIPLAVLYEDDDILVVDKQPGLVVHPVARHRHDTLLNALDRKSVV